MVIVSIINFEALVDEGTIDPRDLDLFTYVETAGQAWDAIRMLPESVPETR